ncbi:MAG: hypothetical protein ACTJG2_00800 [Candidatus Saccharimonadales bacterium]
MRQPITIENAPSKEYVAELLKERIYATVALLAVLISVDTNHATPLHAELIVAGTIISLWAASLLATLMSRRIVYGKANSLKERREQFDRHAPMLATLTLPLFVMTLSAFGLLPLTWAVNTSIVMALLPLIIWSIVSARSFGLRRIPTIILISLELAIGLGIVSLKVIVGH